MLAEIVVLVMGGVFCVAVVLSVLSSADFTIRIRGGRVRIDGRMAGAVKGEIADFFEREFSDHESMTVRGWIGNGDRLKLRFRGNVPPGDQQRIRNFLVLVVCR